MNSQAIETQAKMYVFDLHNYAREKGFKTSEGWEVTQATTEQKAELEKKYQLTVSAKVLTEDLPRLFELINLKLDASQLLAKRKNSAEARVLSNEQYLVAYNPDRVKH